MNLTRVQLKSTFHNTSRIYLLNMTNRPETEEEGEKHQLKCTLHYQPSQLDPYQNASQYILLILEPLGLVSLLWSLIPSSPHVKPIWSDPREGKVPTTINSNKNNNRNTVILHQSTKCSNYNRRWTWKSNLTWNGSIITNCEGSFIQIDSMMNCMFIESI